MKELTKEQKEYLIELLEDKIFMDKDIAYNENHPTDVEYYEVHINKMNELIKILQ
jgi:hypothetical protein